MDGYGEEKYWNLWGGMMDVVKFFDSVFLWEGWKLF